MAWTAWFRARKCGFDIALEMGVQSYVKRAGLPSTARRGSGPMLSLAVAGERREMKKMELRPLENYIEDLQVANPRIMGPVVERQARLQRSKDFHDAVIEALIRLTSDQARAREIWERWGHNSLRLRGQRAIFKAQLISAGLLTSQEAAEVAVKYAEPKLAVVKK